MYLQELGGENSSRLVLGGLLADLSAEHYSWVASGDTRNPDATRVQERADAFLARLRTLFDEAMILTLPDTYTGATLEFLKKSSYYRIGNSVQTVGIGDWNSDSGARAIIRRQLHRVRVVVANMREYMKVYRPEHSWLHAFTAFRLPSPLAASAAGADPPRRAEALASLHRICREASLPEQQTTDELLKLLPRAEKFHREAACPASVAWGACLCRVAGAPKCAPHRGTLHRLEDGDWQPGAALSPRLRDPMPPAGTVARRDARNLRGRGAGTAEQDAAAGRVPPQHVLPAGAEDASAYAWQWGGQEEATHAAS